MLERVIKRPILLCLLVSAILVHGSSRSYWNDVVRGRRHATCPSCHQDCPDALSSPWYGNPLHNEPDRPHRGHQRQDYPRWSGNQPLQAAPRIFPNSHPQQQPSRTPVPPRPPFQTENTCRRENPFEFRPRIIDPRPPSPSPSPAYPAERLLTRTFPSRPFGQPQNLQNDGSQSGPRNFYDLMSQRAQVAPLAHGSDRYFDDRHTPAETSSVDAAADENANDGGRRKYYVVYRADNGNSDEEGPRSVEGVSDRYHVRGNSDWRQLDAPRQPDESLKQVQQSLTFRQPRKDRLLDPSSFGASEVLHQPVAQQNSYGSFDENVFKTMQGTERQAPVYQARNAWQDEDLESGVVGEGQTMGLEGEEGYQATGGQVTNGEDQEDPEEKTDLLSIETANEEAGKNDTVAVDTGDESPGGGRSIVEGQRGRNETKEQVLSSLDLDLIEDVEDPPVEPTEATPIELSTESSKVST